jgi:hypothetical protein
VLKTMIILHAWPLEGDFAFGNHTFVELIKNTMWSCVLNDGEPILVVLLYP